MDRGYSTNEDLARRAVACRAWRWLPAMRWAWVGSHAPDLEHPATLGCVLGLVRDAYGDASLDIARDGEDWAVADKYGREVSRGPSDREALVLALEAAP